MMGENDGAKVCKCSHHSFAGIFIIVFGLLFLAGNMGYISSSTVDWGWPTLVILGGIFHMTKRMCKCC